MRRRGEPEQLPVVGTIIWIFHMEYKSITAPEADGVECLNTRYYLKKTSIPLLSVVPNNEDFTLSDAICGAL